MIGCRGRRDSPCIVVNRRNVVTCRILSQSAVIGRYGQLDTKKRATVPKPPRHFLIIRGLSRIREESREPKEFFPKVLRHSLTKYGELSRIDRIRKLDSRWPGQTFLSGNRFAIPLSVERVFCARTSLFSGDQKYYRPATPSPFPLYATAGGNQDGIAKKKFGPEKPMPLP